MLHTACCYSNANIIASSVSCLFYLKFTKLRTIKLWGIMFAVENICITIGSHYILCSLLSIREN